MMRQRRRQRCVLVRAKQRVSVPRCSQLAGSPACCACEARSTVAQDVRTGDPGPQQPGIRGMSVKIDQNCADRGRSRSAIRKTAMKLRIGRLLAIAAFVCCGLASARTLAQNAYITNGFSNNVSVISTATNAVTATIPVGAFPVGVAASPDGSKVYVASAGANTVSVIAAASNTVTATIPGGGQSGGVAVSPDGSKLYVTNFNQGGPGTVSVIATATNTVTATIPVDNDPLRGGPTGVAVSPDGSKVYVTSFNLNNVSVIAAASNTVIATITVGDEPA